MSQHLSQFELQLSQWERDETLLKTSTVVHRLEVLDELDACIALSANSTPDILTRARLLSSRLEEVNTSLYSSIRQQIEKGRCPSEFLAILRDTSSPVPRGLHYDHLDDLISGVFQFRPPTDDPRPLGRDSVFYQPTPARHIFHLISAASVTNADTLIDPAQAWATSRSLHPSAPAQPPSVSNSTPHGSASPNNLPTLSISTTSPSSRRTHAKPTSPPAPSSTSTLHSPAPLSPPSSLPSAFRRRSDPSASAPSAPAPLQ